MQLDESNAEKTHLHYENKRLRARLDEIERSDKAAKTSHRNSMQEKDAIGRDSVHGRHGMDGTKTHSNSYSTASLARSEHAQKKDHSIGFIRSDCGVGERNLTVPEVYQALLLFLCRLCAFALVI